MRLSAVVFPLAFAPLVLGGPIAYGICQAGCTAAAATCYSAAGFIFGIYVPPLAPAAITACNTALATCSAACYMSWFAPTP
ncbi:hypothetical protein BDQ17DRAFT_1413669 [Cyathus striatus]|nr:hypothetical protein BDQ17DRAFT_1263431 [Cyathus striatus]KAF8991524.1 hypothetical protein BDQ17DRAFT_1413669 [Cyathus striatus]